MENKINILRIWIVLNMNLFISKTNFSLFLNSLWVLKENSKFLIIMQLLNFLFQEILNKYDVLDCNANFLKTLIIHISQSLFFMEGVIKKCFKVKNVDISSNIIDCLKTLLILLKKHKILYVYLPFNSDNFDIMSESNFWKKSESQYSNIYIFKEGGILISFFNIIIETLNIAIIKKENENISILVNFLEQISFETPNILNNLSESIQTYEEYFKEIPITTETSNYGNEISTKLFLLVINLLNAIIFILKLIEILHYEFI